MNNILPVLCICIGFFVGYNLNSDHKKIEIPEAIKNPKKYVKQKIKDKRESKQVEKETEYINDVLHNIEVFDGTARGQKQVKEVNK